MTPPWMRPGEAFQPDPIGYGTFLIPELAEAAAGNGNPRLVEHAQEWLAARPVPSTRAG